MSSTEKAVLKLIYMIPHGFLCRLGVAISNYLSHLLMFLSTSKHAVMISLIVGRKIRNAISNLNNHIPQEFIWTRSTKDFVKPVISLSPCSPVLIINSFLHFLNNRPKVFQIIR